MKKKEKKIFIISGVVVFLVGSWLLVTNVFYYSIFGEKYSPVNYVSNGGFEATFPATPVEYTDIALVRHKQVQFYSTLVEMKDKSVYFVDYISLPLDKITVDEAFIKDLVIATNGLYDDYSLVVTPVKPFTYIFKYDIEYHDDKDNMESLVFFDPTYEAFYIVGVWQPVKKDINSDMVTSFISSFRLTYEYSLSEDEIISDETAHFQNVLTYQPSDVKMDELPPQAETSTLIETPSERDVYNFSINKIGSATHELNIGKDSFSVGLDHLLDKNYSLAVTSFTEALQYYNSALETSESLNTSEPLLILREDFVTLKNQSIELINVNIQTAELYKAYAELGVYNLIDASTVEDFADADEKLQLLDSEVAGDFFPTYSAVASKGVALFN